MKICIDATPIGIETTDKGGVYRYIFELITALQCLDRENHYTLFFNFFRKRHLATFQETVRRLHVGEHFHIRLSRFPVRLRHMLGPPVELFAGGFDVFHGCFDSLPPRLSGKGVVTIHDVRYLEEHEDPRSHAEWVDVLQKVSPAPAADLRDYLARDALFSQLRSTIARTLRRADAVITVSEFCRKKILALTALPKEKIRVVYHGVDARFRPLSRSAILPVLDKHGITTPYILYTGKYDPSKNLMLLLEVFKKLAVRRDVRLVMAGPRNWFSYLVREKARQLAVLDKVVFTDYVTNEDLVALYNGASVFSFLSLYEGFGMPLLEAMACGVPVLTSRLCSMPEVVGEAALFIDPKSASDIERGLSACLDDERLREVLVHKGFEQAKKFTWERTAEETLRVYRSV